MQAYSNQENKINLNHLNNDIMGKVPKNQGKEWSAEDLKKLNNLAKGNTPTPLIAYDLGRSEGAIRNKAGNEEISLKPTNKSPYDRKVHNAKINKK
jgi:hypothetical protein